MKKFFKEILKTKTKVKAEKVPPITDTIGPYQFIRETGSLEVKVTNTITGSLAYKFDLHPTMKNDDISNMYADVASRLGRQLIAN